MVNEKKKEKKPLVTLDVANPAPDGVVKTEQAGAGWAGNQGTRGGEQQLQEDTPQLTEQQVDNIKRAPSGVSVKDINKVPGSGEVKLPASATKYGVLQGAPSQVILQHMIDAIPVETEEQRKRREKAEKRNALFAAIGDGVSALSNLYFTTKGSPSADQSKSLSKAESDRKDKARKERESNIEKRLRLLKEQRAELNNLESQRLKDRQLEIMEKYREGMLKAANDRVDELRRNNTAERVRNAEKDKAEAKRKDDLNKSAVDRNKAAAEKSRSDARVNQQKGNAYVRDANDRMAKRGGSSKYNGPTTRAVYDSKGRLKGYTVSSRGSSPAKPSGGSGSAKSKFSIHK